MMKDSPRDTIEKLLRRTGNRLLAVRAAETAAVWAIIGSLAASAAMTVSIFHTPPFSVSWFLALPAVAALAGALTRIAGGISTVRAGIFLDTKYRLFEQMSMAAELAGRDDHSATAECIYRQAANRTGDIPRKISYRQLGPKTIALLLLSISLCLVLRIPAMAAENKDPDVENLFGLIEELDESRRADITRRMQDGGRISMAPEAVANIEQIIEVRSREKFDLLIEKLRKQGVDIQEIRNFIDRSGKGGRDGGATKHKMDKSYGRLEPGKNPVSIPVYVSPSLSSLASESETQAKSNSRGNLMDGGNSWKKARMSASRRLKEENIRREYRPIIRSFFLPEQQ